MAENRSSSSPSSSSSGAASGGSEPCRPGAVFAAKSHSGRFEGAVRAGSAAAFSGALPALTSDRDVRRLCSNLAPVTAAEIWYWPSLPCPSPLPPFKMPEKSSE